MISFIDLTFHKQLRNFKTGAIWREKEAYLEYKYKPSSQNIDSYISSPKISNETLFALSRINPIHAQHYLNGIKSMLWSVITTNHLNVIIRQKSRTWDLSGNFPSFLKYSSSFSKIRLVHLCNYHYIHYHLCSVRFSSISYYHNCSY